MTKSVVLMPKGMYCYLSNTVNIDKYTNSLMTKAVL